MVKQVLQETTIPHMLVSADNVDKANSAWIGEMWATARARMKASNEAEFLLVIDEVHKLDNWSEAVKKEWDEVTIEVKSGRRTTNNGLAVFRKRFHPMHSFVVGSGGVPIEEFLTWDIGKLLEV